MVTRAWTGAVTIRRPSEPSSEPSSECAEGAVQALLVCVWSVCSALVECLKRVDLQCVCVCTWFMCMCACVHFVCVYVV